MDCVIGHAWFNAIPEPDRGLHVVSSQAGSGPGDTSRTEGRPRRSPFLDQESLRRAVERSEGDIP